VDLTHSFTVPVDRPTAWAAFQDIESVAECFPGAAVTSVEGDTFEGTCKVKLGPIALQYSGSGAFIERDVEAFRMLLEAKGRDKRGNGTAGATVTTTFLEEGPSSTRVEVVTDLSITGKPAQFGRGVMQDVSDKLLGQFVTCLEARVGPPPAQPAAEAVTEEATAQLPPAEPPTVQVGGTAGAPRGQEAIDLGTTVLPVLARTYWKPLAGVLLVLLVIRWLRRR
jgi:carbon monoxide dehydrogenase subunit G